MNYLKKIILLLITLIFFACNSAVKQAEILTINFYSNCMRKNFQAIIPYLDKEMLKTVPADKWLNTLKKLQQERGDINKFNIVKIKTYMDSKGYRIIEITTNVFYEKQNFYETLFFIKRQKDLPYHIIKYEYVSEIKK